MPGESPEEDYILKILERAQTLKDGIEIYVSKVCEVLKSLHERCERRESGSLPEALKNSLTKHFRDIFWSLKLHLLFHGVPWPYAALEDIGAWELVSLSADQMQATPDEKSVIDPGSKILEIVSDITQREDVPKGSPQHVQKVMKEATDLFRSIPDLFRPKVLAVVSHNGESFVGASISVSNFLRPLYLHKRIADFKNASLRKAIIFHQPLETEYTQEWRSKAKMINNHPKPACGSCRRTFKNLKGFVPENVQGDDRNRSILGACAEYCPVDKLLHHETNDDPEIGHRLQKNLRRCLELFKKFNAIVKQCQEAVNSGNIQKIKQVYEEVHPILDIFGRSPEFNDRF